MTKIKTLLGKYYFQFFWLVVVSFYTILRLPSLFLKHFSLDEGVYIAVAWDLNNGQQLYSQTWDHKPPLIYWLYSILLKISDYNYWIIPATNFLLGFVSIVLIYLVAKNFLTLKLSLISAFIATIVLGFPTLESHIFNGENLFVPLTLAGAYLFLKNQSLEKKPKLGKKEVIQTLLAGCFWSLASLTKAQPVVEIVGFLIGYLTVSLSSIKFALKKVFIVGLPVVICWVWLGLYYYTKGYLDWALYSIFFTNSDYIDQTSKQFATFLSVPLFNGKEYIPDQSGISDMLWRTSILALFTGLISYIVWKIQCFKSSLVDHKYRALSATTKARFIFIFWTIFAIFAAFLSGRNYSHYLLQVVPQFSISIVLFCSIIWANWSKISPKEFSPKWNSLVASLIVVVIFWQYLIFIFGGGSYYLSFDAYPAESYYRNFYWELANGNISSWQNRMFAKKVWFYPVDKMITQINENSKPEDKIWTYINFPALAFYAKRQSGYLTKTWFHIDDKSRPRVLDELKKDPPKLILWDNTERDDPVLKAYIKENYTLKTHVLDMFDQSPRYEIWVLN
jgi:4-amino-4-deoxy-L-arabinose transferase-like glycosyltransferase